MTARPFYLPLISPPAKDPSNPAGYYQTIKTLGTLSVDFPSGDTGLELTITNSDKVHPAAQGDPTLPLATVFAPTSGFVRYYPAADPLPTPDKQPIGLPPTLITPQDVGSLVINVWIVDFEYLMRLRSAITPRPNRILLGRVRKTSVEDAFSREISTLGHEVLVKAWKDGGGSGNPPNDTALQTVFLQRLMAGTAEIFVKAGTPLGRACLINDPLGVAANVAHTKTMAWFAPSDANAQAEEVPAEDLIDSVLEDSGRSPLFTGHPLLDAINGDITVTFKSEFWERDRATRTYVSFANKQVNLKRNNGETMGQTTTDASGRIDLQNVDLKKNDVIWFELVRPLKVDLLTNSHKARWFLDANNVNTNLYRASYRVQPDYATFINDLTIHEDDEKFLGDRGNSFRRDRPGVVVYGKGAMLRPTQREMVREIKDAEKNLNSDPPPNATKTFTILIEGDSWLNYPLFNNDIYVHLYDMLQGGKKDGITINIFPLQHAGDRADQMFEGGTPTSPRQWDFTFDLLSQYPVDLIFFSAGGNDFAEPGISVDDKDRFQGRFIQEGDADYFNPFLPEVPNSGAPDPAATAKLLDLSFASMLKTHRWNYKVRNDTEANYLLNKGAVLQQLAAKMSTLTNLGESDPAKQPGKLQEIGDNIIHEMAERDDFPDKLKDIYDEILATVFDLTRYRARFDSVKQNLQRLMDVASPLHIPVLTHTYCYPLYNEKPTFLGPESERGRIVGPWFKPRFIEAGIDDRRVHKICLKALLDHYVMHILQPFNDKYKEVDPNQNIDLRFEYVDVRDWCMDTVLWRDEMHLRSDGFIKIARELYHRIAVRFPQLFKA